VLKFSLICTWSNWGLSIQFCDTKNLAIFSAKNYLKKNQFDNWNFRNCFATETHTQRRKAANFIFIFILFLWRKSVEKSPMKTYMVKRVFWKISKKKTKSWHFQEGKKKNFEIATFWGGKKQVLKSSRFGQIPSFLLLKRVLVSTCDLRTLWSPLVF